MVGILAWMVLKRLLAETKGTIKEETIVDHQSQNMVWWYHMLYNS